MILAVTPGDPEGIGPEIVWKTLKKNNLPARVRVLCVGASQPFRRLGAPIVRADPNDLRPPQSNDPFVWLLEAPPRAPRGVFLPGYQAGWSIEAATLLALRKEVAGIVTGPISKERLWRGGFSYPGHTEFLASLCGAKDVTMMLANDTLRVSLVTTHLALKDVPKALTRTALRRAVLHTTFALGAWWKIKSPRVAVSALNPHSGEGGAFGKEEIRVIQPEIQSLRRMARRKYSVEGPFSADTFFANHLAARPGDRHDAVVCMYHDQGLIPVKLLDFQKTVNVTLGLPIIRTSVDHGVGFDIAGKGIADPSSFDSALRLAAKLCRA